MRPIQLKFVTIAFNDHGCLTTFPGGEDIGAYPHWDDHHYHVIAHRCGYEDDLLAYCREHEVMHSWLCERLQGAPSSVLWELANGREPDPVTALQEEVLVQMFQRYLRANEQPILGGWDWGAMKREALRLLADVA